MLSIAVGPKFSVFPGESAYLDAETCALLVRDGFAVYLDEQESTQEPALTPEADSNAAVPVPESATLEPSEAPAVQPRARGRQRARGGR